MSLKERIDILLFNKGICSSREKAKALVMSGNIFIGTDRIDKAGTTVDINSDIIVKQKKNSYVSRGGQKLEKSIKKNSINLLNKICMDIGASTGGFTDCMIKNFASKVYCVDVGYGQLDWELRKLDNIINLERTNIRFLSKDKVLDDIDFISVDVSFISLKIIIPILEKFLKEDGEAVILIKPQFEAGKGNVGKNGVVKDPKIHLNIIYEIYNYCIEKLYSVLDIDYSPVKGPKGNIEYIMYIKRCRDKSLISYSDIDKVVHMSHESL